MVTGITPPLLRLPVQEPHCYLPVIAGVEGKLESINAWDLGAGVSLGVIQFNADRAALFRFLWRLWSDDVDLFRSALTASLQWSMRWDGDHPDLVVRAGAGSHVLHGRGADTAINAAYLQSGRPGSATRDPVHRRRVSAALRDVVVWPHVQEMVVDVSAWWLAPALAQVRAEGIGPLDPSNPDHDTYVLTALLLSAAVRFSGCLRPLLVGLRRWPTVPEKLRHLEQVVQSASARCRELLPRLRAQQGDADAAHDQLGRLLRVAPVPVRAVGCRVP